MEIGRVKKLMKCIYLQVRIEALKNDRALLSFILTPLKQFLKTVEVGKNLWNEEIKE